MGEKVKCVNGLVLKLIAIGTMLTDHIGAVLFPENMLLRVIGRIAFPIFVFLLVEGFLHTGNIRKYELRLLVFAFVSEVPFNLAFTDMAIEWAYQNVFFTLFLGVVMLDAIQNVRARCAPAPGVVFEFLLLIGFMAAAWFLKTDYDAGGVLLVYLFYRLRGRPLWQTVVLGAVSFVFFGVLECFSVIAMAPIALYNGKRGFAYDGLYGGRKKGAAATAAKYLFYIFYPVHLLILWTMAG